MALSRIAWATLVHFGSRSGVILSAVLSVAIRCSTVSGLLLVAAAAAGGFWLSGVCAVAGASEPAIRATPAKDAMANERARGVNRFVMRCFLFQRSGYAAPGCRGPAANRGTPRAQNRFRQNS